MSHRRPKVIYIAGTGRSGSTLLERMLGQLTGFCAAGELRYILERSFVDDYPCGCGRPFSACPFWQAVVREAYGDWTWFEPGEYIELKWRVDRVRHIPGLLSPVRGRAYSDNLSAYLGHLGRLYSAISKVANGRVIVDSSKDPSYLYTLAHLPDVELYVVHLVRDSRGHAHSWLRHKVAHQTSDGKKTYMTRYSTTRSTLWWMQANVLTELLRLRQARYIRVRYEKMIQDPQTIVHNILNFVREDEQVLPLVHDGAVQLEADHTVSGNPLRFERGEIELRLDEEWKHKMKKADARLVTALSWPLLLRYGYLKRKS